MINYDPRYLAVDTLRILWSLILYSVYKGERILETTKCSHLFKLNVINYASQMPTWIER